MFLRRKNVIYSDIALLNMYYRPIYSEWKYVMLNSSALEGYETKWIGWWRAKDVSAEPQPAFFKSSWASYQLRKIAGCACTGNAGNVSPATDFKGNPKLAIRRASRHVGDARAVIHIGISNQRCRGKRSRYSQRMRNPQFYVSGKRTM